MNREGANLLVKKRVEEIRAWPFTCMRLSVVEADRIARKEFVAAKAFEVDQNLATLEQLQEYESLFNVTNPLQGLVPKIK